MANLVSTINFQELLTALLANLSDRERDVLKKRYHLTSELAKRSTLKQIGDFYNITRERVRQIERDAIRKMNVLKVQSEYAEQLKSLENELVAYLEQNGGLVREDHLLARYATQVHNFDSYHTNAYLFVLENLLDAAKRTEDHGELYTVWSLRDLALEKVLDLLRDVEATLRSGSQTYGKENLQTLSKEKLSADLKGALDKYLQKHSQAELTHFIDSYLSASSRIEENILGQWGIADWENVGPRKLGDKIHLIFQKETKPLHFRQIAENINQAGFDRKKVCAATVHNELIANDRYVLIGRGIYALKDWGYETGTVSEVVANILKASGRAMSKDEIFEEVLKRRKVNRSTIYLTLINKDKFERVDGNLFRVK